MSSGSLSYWGRILALVGGIILVIFGIIGFLGYLLDFAFFAPVFSIRAVGRELIAIILGIIAIIGSYYAGTLAWSIGLIILGYEAGGLGRLLVLIGGILGLVAALVKKV